MKRSIRSLLLSVLAAFTFVLSACGSSPQMSPSAPRADAAPQQTSSAAPPADGAAGENEGGFTADGSATQDVASPEGRKNIWRSALVLESMEFDRAITVISEQVSAAGGYIEAQHINGRSLNYEGEYYARSAQINARIPSNKLGQVTSAIGKTCNIVSQSQTSEDITDRYFDTEAHLAALEVKEERLLEIMKKAVELQDIFELERELADVRYEIESFATEKRHMDSQVAYSYLSMELSEVTQLTVPVAPPTFNEKMSAAAARTGVALTKTGQSIALFCVGVLPLLLIWGAVIAALVFAGFKVNRLVQSARSRQESQPFKPKDKDDPSNEK